MREKRVHQRKPLDRDVLCYIDGQRFDASASDISTGGMFIRTCNSKAINLNALVGLVFPGGTNTMTTFLFGRVVRHQTQPEEGLGLHWEKAVSAGQQDVLAKFLLVLLGITNPRIQVETTTRGTRSIYKFDTGPAADSVERTRTNDAQFTSRIKDLYKSPSEGALTGFIKREDTSFECYIKGLLSENGRKIPVLITRLGISSALARTVFEHDEFWSKVDLQFEIPTKEGQTPIVGRGEVRLINPEDPHCLLVSFSYLDEGASTGIYGRYLKWLQFHALAKSPDHAAKATN